MGDKRLTGLIATLQTQGVKALNASLRGGEPPKLRLNQPTATIPAETLATLTDLARRHVHDIEEGLEDGEYVRSENQDLPAKQAAVRAGELACREAMVANRNLSQAELVSKYESKLEKVKVAHPGWKGEEYVAHAERELAAVKARGMQGLKELWPDLDLGRAADSGDFVESSVRLRISLKQGAVSSLALHFDNHHPGVAAELTAALADAVSTSPRLLSALKAYADVVATAPFGDLEVGEDSSSKLSAVQLKVSAKMAAEAAYMIGASEAELGSRAKEFMSAYDNPRGAWQTLRDHWLTQVGDLKSTRMRAAVYDDLINDEEALQALYFDKFFPALKTAHFPPPESAAWYAATQDVMREWLLQTNTQSRKLEQTETELLSVLIPARAARFAAEESMTAAMRVVRLEQAIKAWHVADETRGPMTDNDAAADEDAVVLMLADMRHYCDQHGLDFGQLDRGAYADYCDQLDNDRHHATLSPSP